MQSLRIYEVGKQLPLSLPIPSVDEDLEFVRFPYNSSDVILTALTAFFAFLFLAIPFLAIFPFVGYILIYFAIVGAVVLYLYPVNVYYFQTIREYQEEMLKAILRLSVHVSLETSLEKAFQSTAKHLRGILAEQFQDIVDTVLRKEEMTMGEAMNNYTDIWNDVDPVFVKSLRLLQTASISPPDERERIINETTETLLVNYKTVGKRFAEDLTSKAKKLIAGGVLVPILSLLLLPILSIFMPSVVRPSILAFVYTVFFPTGTFLMALNFASQRLQIDTIRMEEAERYEPMPLWIYLVAFGIVLVFSIPTLIYVNYVISNNITSLDSVFMLLMGWLMSFGCYLGILFVTRSYTKRYENLWNEVNEVEQDLPHLLQSFSTYLTLNMSVENILPAIVNDYKRFGFGDSPVVTAFNRIILRLNTTKKKLTELVEESLEEILPSKKVTEIITQIVSFSEISQDSASRVAKRVREQNMSLYELDDYMKTLLADSVSLINITMMLLAPMLTAAAIIMSVAIVKSLTFITSQFEQLGEAFGMSQGMSLNLVNVESIVPPVAIEAIVGMYLIETILALSYFSTAIEVGNDKYRIAKNMESNIHGFLVYSIILFGGFFFVIKLLFPAITGT